MPNWCNNSVEIYHDDPAMIERARTAFNDGKFLHEFIPVPLCLTQTISGRAGPDGSPEQIALENSIQDNLNAYNYKDWYSFCVAEWGTKWDVGADGEAQDIPGGLMLGFESAWSPPIAAYERLLEQGFKIRAMYYEPGMCFAGVWDNGADDFYEYGDMNSVEAAETLPPELDEAFCISESMAEYEAENIDIDLDEGLSAVNEQEQMK